MRKKTILNVVLTTILAFTFLGCESNLDNNKSITNPNSTTSEATNNSKASSSETAQTDGYPDDTQTSEQDKLYLLSCIVGIGDVLKDGYISGTEMSSLSSIIKNLKSPISPYGQSNSKINSDLIIVIGQLAKISKDMDEGKNVESEKSTAMNNLKICLNNFYLKNYKTKGFSSIVSATEEVCKVKITFDANSKFQDITQFPLY
jgi:hypothetical protein